MRRCSTTLALLVTVTLTLGTGCDGDPAGAAGGGEPRTCTAHSACGEGAACLAGACASFEASLEAAAQCAADADCGESERCADGRCAAAEGDELLRCDSNADCPAWSACLEAHCVVLADADGDGARFPEDCDDLDAAIGPGQAEAADGVDNDCDGLVDEGADATATELCNGLDDDLDGEIDEDCEVDEGC